jgi:DNA end-binding protein Ku
MARAVWSGVISFGLVSVPVGLYTATEEHEPTFHQFQEGSSDRIRYKRVNERTGKEVDYSDIAKGADVGGGHYVMLTDDDLSSVAPGRSRSLDIERFVDLDEIDPVYFSKSYYLAPGSDETKKTYALLREAMASSNKAAVGTFVMHGKEHLAAIRAAGPVLVLETLFFADEVRDPKAELDGVPSRGKFRGEEMAMATQLIETMSGPWRPKDYHDTYTDRVNELIKSKNTGEEFEPSDAAPDATNVVDLMDALQRSVDAARAGRRSPAKKQPAKQTRGKKTASSQPKATARKPSKKTAAKKATTKKTTAGRRKAS